MALGRASESVREKALHGIVVKEYASQDGKVPDIVTRAAVVEAAREEALWDLGRVEKSTDKVHEDALGDGCVEVDGPFQASRHDQLRDRDEASQGERDVENHSRPCHVGAVESRVPGQDDAADSE